MHIEKIHIKNFKCFKNDFILELNNHLNIIVGDNEAGKSTIIEAIHLALSGWYKGRYFHNELTQSLFNKVIVDEYIQSIRDGNPQIPPAILIELYFSNDVSAEFKGNQNTEGIDSFGLRFHVQFDERYKIDYEHLVNSGDIQSLPIEYYNFYWESFARDERISPRRIPIKSALIDNAGSRYQNGSDVYISKIVKEYLEPKEVVEVSQAHRRMKEVFMNEDAIKAINKKIQTDSNITTKKVEVSVELSSKNAWESSLVTYLDEIPFHHVGKGEQAIIKTKLALSHKKAHEANILLIEEPENHLSHTKLNQLLKDIQVGSSEKQIIVSTHNSFVANKLGLESIILLNSLTTTKLSDLSEETYLYFKRLSGYDTLRLLLCNRAILVEGDSDELIVQKAYLKKHKKLPIEDGVDVISVGTSFLRFLEIADKLKIKTVVVTDTDWSVEALEKKYASYLGDNSKEYINISYDPVMDEGDLEISGKKYNYNTLEPKMLKENSLEVFNEIFDKNYDNENDLRKYMESKKTICALQIFESDKDVVFPAYIDNAV